MALSATFTVLPQRGLRQALAAPFKAVWHGLILLAEAGPCMDQVRKLNAMSDADLAARGLTREGEVRRIFVDRYYV